MAELISEARHVSRKPRLCEHCCCTIPTGTRYFRQFIAEGGYAWAWVSHEDCHEAALYLFDQDGGGYGDELTALHDYEDATGEFPDHIRGFWPHVICRLEFKKQIAEARYQKRLAEIQRRKGAGE